MQEIFKVSNEELTEMMFEGNYGICRKCGEFKDGVEPDADGYKCDSCGSMSVVGLEFAVIEGIVEVEDE